MPEDDDIEFPIITAEMPSGKILDMDNYWRFVEFNIKHTVDMNFQRKLRMKEKIDVPFSWEDESTVGAECRGKNP